MGKFEKPTTSEERFMRSSMQGRHTNSVFGRTASGSQLLPPLTINATQTSQNSRTPSNNSNRGGRDGDRRSKRGHQIGGPTIPMEMVTPLERSENRWVSMSVTGEIPKAGEDIIPMETIHRKVKALLNKLTLEKFEAISDRIIEFANKSKEERDGRILKTVIQLTFEKACDEPNFSQMYAQLCRKMMERIDMDIFDENIKNASDEYVRGGTLFRKYLLNRCQDGFEKGWKANMPIPNNVKGEPDLLSDEYYIAAKAKRHGLGLIKFIGELFKLNMLTERIMHECIKKLLANHQDPEEEETESLCKLLTTVGKQLDHQKAKDHMDAYFVRMDSMSKNTKLNSRIRFMLLVIMPIALKEMYHFDDSIAINYVFL